jgi:hypothetical protein
MATPCKSTPLLDDPIDALWSAAKTPTQLALMLIARSAPTRGMPALILEEESRAMNMRTAQRTSGPSGPS